MTVLPVVLLFIDVFTQFVLTLFNLVGLFSGQLSVVLGHPGGSRYTVNRALALATKKQGKPIKS